MADAVSPSNPSASDGSTRRLNAALPWLTRIAQGSSSFIGIFLAIHLTAPAMANLGGSSLASQVMLLGREYYQTPFGEASLVLAPIGIHAFTSITKRYAMFFVFAPIHFITHRLNPTSPDAPIYSVGPSELDYEFVKVGLQTWPWRNWLLYTGLVICTALHAAEGSSLVMSTFFANSFDRKRWRARTRRTVAALSTIPVLTGVLSMATEPLMTFSSLALRYHESFTKSYIFRL
ncbi:hypothetical protein OE88DRAFT_1715324 [Heliocybe sulcata]|uniref:Mitochondrial adapter protein MCP1 transmembrane domain-containing protein n=1 Tax=Heliocybe sulcata TaxID=5364 RepID=A0A5C3MNK2_9AGAM|nr:hypothetical protein OE88DRAFT_1715324 [Heliocybe sulcata]